jgi:YfiH family protein
MPLYIKPERSIASGAVAVSTTRGGGVSLAPFGSFNLAFHVGDDMQAVENNRKNLSQDLSACAIQWLEQVHGNAFIQATKDTTANAFAADGAWTTVPGLAIAIMTADCLPVLMASTDPGVVAGAHCGWKGLQTSLLSRLIKAMPCAPAELSVWLPPAIGQSNYEVDDRVVANFPERFVNNPECVRASQNKGHYLLSLAGIAQMQLRELGVEDVQVSNICVRQDTRFFSYRRNPITGRMASLIWLEG